MTVCLLLLQQKGRGSMGTSNIFYGPVKPLLPDGYDDASDDGEDDDTTPDSEKPLVSLYRWKDAKTSMTNYVKGRSSDRGRVMNRYVSAAGGSRRLSQSSVVIRQTKYTPKRQNIWA